MGTDLHFAVLISVSTNRQSLLHRTKIVSERSDLDCINVFEKKCSKLTLRTAVDHNSKSSGRHVPEGGSKNCKSYIRKHSWGLYVQLVWWQRMNETKVLNDIFTSRSLPGFWTWVPASFEQPGWSVGVIGDTARQMPWTRWPTFGVNGLTSFSLAEKQQKIILLEVSQDHDIVKAIVLLHIDLFVLLSICHPFSSFVHSFTYCFLLFICLRACLLVSLHLPTGGRHVKRQRNRTHRCFRDCLLVGWLAGLLVCVVLTCLTYFLANLLNLSHACLLLQYVIQYLLADACRIYLHSVLTDNSCLQCFQYLFAVLAYSTY